VQTLHLSAKEAAKIVISALISSFGIALAGGRLISEHSQIKK
jgi:hypothetical protein